ncbi:MAG: tetratricopeptide repeat protein, partial [Proteobacteria bacterium]|nr:tetratricopeptide repeat protein [Pseudomonadota bacterium]
MDESTIFTEIGTALSAGNPVEAERLCRGVLAEIPNHVDALLALALSLHAQHRIDDATTAFQRLTQVQPDSAVHWSNYATIL